MGKLRYENDFLEGPISPETEREKPNLYIVENPSADHIEDEEDYEEVDGLPWYVLLLVGGLVAVPTCILKYKFDRENIRALEEL
jgi:hypothetical protein